MRQLDLFAGIGGISLAAEWAGIETVAFCEKEPFAQDILRRRFPGRPIYDDVFNLTKEVLRNDGIYGVDIVAGGFPCQPFSHAGKRAGTTDDRYLWPQMCRIIEEVRPSWVFAENVDGLVSMAQSGGELVMEDETAICTEAEMVLETIRKDLEAIGYQCIPVIIPACGVGASHRRYRISIVAFTDSDRQWTGNGFQQSKRDTSGECFGNRRALGEIEVMADTAGERCRETRNGISGSTSRITGRGIMGNSAFIGLQRNGATRERLATVYGTKKLLVSPSSHRTDRSTQSGLGGSPYELSDWLDGWGMNPLDALINFITSFPQPALMGQEQYAWEPPRIAIGVKNRAARLKALGNAVDPLQFLPILYGIRVIHEFLLGEERLAK